MIELSKKGTDDINEEEKEGVIISPPEMDKPITASIEALEVGEEVDFHLRKLSSVKSRVYEMNLTHFADGKKWKTHRDKEKIAIVVKRVQ